MLLWSLSRRNPNQSAPFRLIAAPAIGLEDREGKSGDGIGDPEPLPATTLL